VGNNFSNLDIKIGPAWEARCTEVTKNILYKTAKRAGTGQSRVFRRESSYYATIEREKSSRTMDQEKERKKTVIIIY